MSSYNSETDFITRTKTLLEKYGQYNLKNPQAETYDVTLLLNCFVGLIVYPQQQYRDKIPSVKLDGDLAKYIQVIKGEEKTLKEVVRHIRNSIAHGKITPISEGGESITHVRFVDCLQCDKCGGEITFEAEIPIDVLRGFAIKFADTMLEIVKQ